MVDAVIDKELELSEKSKQLKPLFQLKMNLIITLKNLE